MTERPRKRPRDFSQAAKLVVDIGKEFHRAHLPSCPNANTLGTWEPFDR
jgi:hypothetical protein